MQTGRGARPDIQSRERHVKKGEGSMTEQGMQTAGKLGTLWCNLMHDSPMWPIHDHYECRDCGRQYPVPWSDAAIAPVIPVNAGRVQRVRFSSAILPVVLLMALLPGAWG